VKRTEPRCAPAGLEDVEVLAGRFAGLGFMVRHEKCASMHIGDGLAVKIVDARCWRSSNRRNCKPVDAFPAFIAGARGMPRNLAGADFRLRRIGVEGADWLRGTWMRSITQADRWLPVNRLDDSALPPTGRDPRS